MEEPKNPYGPESTQTPPAVPQPPQPNQQQQPPHPSYGQQAPNNGAPQMPRPDNNLVWGILCTVLCCLPLGIVSIVYASKVDGCYAAGRYDEAVQNAKEALKWAKIGALCAAVCWALYLIVYVGFFAIILAA